ncbi:hypothetical protein [Nocardiopsis sp. FIRDI 009]|uniref:hypothetical protein n=1 Tax=Nocardiopsis sp. FIRDI 009 TaxID=714197 RepID=UPI000E23C677|nr:hypothetical protein [Nocardiopsis sp. FIRDI 009]
MSPTSWPRRLISPSGLAFVLLCFFMPFFTVSCSGAMGDLAITYSGYDLAFNGLPSVDGSFAGEFSDADREDLRSGVQVLALIPLILVVAGAATSAVLPRPFPRSVAAAAAAGLALVLVVVNQMVTHAGAREEMSSEAEVDASMATIQTTAGVGFWFTFLVLLGVTVFSTVEIVLNRRRASGPSAGAPLGATAPQGTVGPPPIAPTQWGPSGDGVPPGPVPGRVPPGFPEAPGQRPSPTGPGRSPAEPGQSPTGPGRPQPPTGPGQSPDVR